MNSFEHQNRALVAITSDPIHGESALRQMLKGLKEIGTIIQLSCVYRRDFRRELEAHEQESNLIMAVLMQTEIEVVTLKGKIADLTQLQGRSRGRLSLLAFNELVVSIPELTLPEPTLAQDQVILTCASEVWGYYHHPVLKQTLTELAKARPLTEDVEFYSQGNYL